MIKTISSLNSNGELLSMKVKEAGTDLDSAGLLIITADGLGSLTGVVNTVGGPNYNGSEINSSRVEQRDIKLTIAVLGGGDREETARLSLYDHFPLLQQITLIVETDTRVAYIVGVVEDRELNIFNKIENAVVSILCPKVWFRDTKSEIITFSGSVPRFSFPFSNNSLTQKLIVFGDELDYVNRNVYNNGDVSTGVIFKLHCSGPVGGEIYIHNVYYRETMRINVSELETILGSPLVLGDDIFINTNVGEKSVVVVRGGVEYDCLNALDKNPDWISLRPGDNSIAYSSSVGDDNLGMTLFYDVLYEGV